MLSVHVAIGDVSVDLTFETDGYSTEMVDDLSQRASLTCVSTYATLRELAQA